MSVTIPLFPAFLCALAIGIIALGITALNLNMHIDVLRRRIKDMDDWNVRGDARKDETIRSLRNRIIALESHVAAAAAEKKEGAA